MKFSFEGDVMAETNEKINIIELLMTIKEDVSSIKTDMSNFKESQRSEHEMVMREISDVRCDYQKELTDLENKFMARFNTLQSVQASTVGDIDSLKTTVGNLKIAEDQKDAKKYRTIVAFVGTGLGGMVLAKLPEIISLIAKLRELGGN